MDISKLGTLTASVLNKSPLLEGCGLKHSDEETGAWSIKLYDGISHDPVFTTAVRSKEEIGPILARQLVKYPNTFAKVEPVSDQ